MSRWIAMWLVAALTTASLAAQGQARDTRVVPAAVPSGTGVLSGIVVSDDGSTKAIRQANVVLIGAMTGVLRVASTDRDGRFSFADLPADRYVVGASKPPYLGSVAGARRPARPGTPVAVGDGQKVTDVTIRMPMGAAISGVITDERGRPSAGAAVVLRQRRQQGTERVFVQVPGAIVSADERGRYRIFGLTPGEYVAAAMPSGGGFPARPLTDADVDAALKGVHVASAPADPSVVYAPVYFPGTSRESDAQTITLTVGEDREGIDIRLEQTRNAGVDGVVMSADGQPVQTVLVMLETLAGSSPITTASTARVSQDGRFTFANVRPGSYTVTARSAGPQASQFAMSPVEIAGSDVSGIQLMMRPALRVAGRIVFDGTAQAPSLAGRSIPLQPVTPGLQYPSQATPTTAAGAFTLTNVMPGRYKIGGPMFFGATSESVTWALQSVVIDGVEVTDMPFEIKGDAPPKEIVVTYGDRWQELSGRLQQSSGAPAPGYTVIVFPADKTYWIAGSRRILTARPGTDGRFTFGGPGPNTLPPGAYLLAAVTDLDRDEQFDPALLQSLVAVGVPITLQPGERKTQDLAIR